MKKILSVIVHFILCNSSIVSAQYANLPIKEHYDILKNHEKLQLEHSLDFISSDNTVPYNCNLPIHVITMAETIGERADYVLKSMLRMYKTTKDMAYLIKFINERLRAQSFRYDTTAAIKKNVVYFELLGHGGLYSLNYERFFYYNKNIGLSWRGCLISRSIRMKQMLYLVLILW